MKLIEKVIKCKRIIQLIIKYIPTMLAIMKEGYDLIEEISQNYEEIQRAKEEIKIIKERQNNVEK